MPELHTQENVHLKLAREYLKEASVQLNGAIVSLDTLMHRKAADALKLRRKVDLLLAELKPKNHGNGTKRQNGSRK